MSVTAQLLRVFQVDKQIRSLQSSLRKAEGFLGEKQREIEQLDARRKTLETQLKQQSAVAAEHEGEARRIEARMEQLRAQMDNAQTNKEYQAFLVELNVMKTEKDRAESAALEQMAKADELRRELAELETKRVEREQVRGVATKDRDTRHGEIAGQLAELS